LSTAGSSSCRKTWSSAFSRGKASSSSSKPGHRCQRGMAQHSTAPACGCFRRAWHSSGAIRACNPSKRAAVKLQACCPFYAKAVGCLMLQLQWGGKKCVL
jgi:hypothetical protein